MTAYWESLLLPAYTAATSVAILVVQAIYCHLRPLPPHPDHSYEQNVTASPLDVEGGILQRIRAHIAYHGGLKIFSFKIARFAGCILLFLTGFAVILGSWHPKTPRSSPSYLFAGISGMSWSTLSLPTLTAYQSLLLGICAVYLYSSVIALCCLLYTPLAPINTPAQRIAKTLPIHLSILLLLTLGTFAVRDLWPLATYSLTPRDLPPHNPSNAVLLWTHIAILAVTAVVIPMLTPHVYIPVDKSNPSPVPNPEQTASLLSFLIYSFLDRIVFLAYRSPHLDYDQLPPLADYDRATHLRDISFPYLDPFKRIKTKKRRHIFFGLMNTFRSEYFVLITTLAVSMAAGFTTPVGVNRLLRYLETNGQDAFVRPWVWVLCLFWGPMLKTISFQWCIFAGTAVLARTESVVTQLIFEHALRLRMVAETEPAKGSDNVEFDSSSTVPSGLASTTCSEPASSGDGAVQEVSEEQGEASSGSLVQPTPPGTNSNTLVESVRSRFRNLWKKRVKGAESIKKPEAVSKKPSVSKLQGRITNLVTTDLANITEARNFVFLLIPLPLQLLLCLVFLHTVLGWSAYVGLGATILMFPLPGYIGRLMQGVHRVRMERTDARVQSVTETMNVLRMVKLFGWARKMDDRIAEKREEELLFVWKYRLLEVANGLINHAIPMITMLAAFATQYDDTLPCLLMPANSKHRDRSL
ncbi:hypothetical protein HGRIS_007432 [Hohenbuehelia grisea]|uniref:ABC transmembrane type-1 domain-containing protein n=1 Tax=Hohenbuehelia grisea TaxID=104357 RepID=A0ABR3J4T0_9AGAR